MAHTRKSRSQYCPVLSPCSSYLNGSKGAVNFSNPVLSVVLATKTGIAKTGQHILEFGAGNLRNARYLQESISKLAVYAYDLEQTINRFPAQYQAFRRNGGIVLTKLPNRKRFELVVCTFVMETICPIAVRVRILRRIKSLLRADGYLVASFRGYGGVRGTGYRKCLRSGGLVSRNKTYIKPHSISEVIDLLHTAGYNEIVPLQKYHSDKPENIHVLAR